MGVFQHVAWGYELTYPQDWVHQTIGEVEGFASNPAALTPDYAGERSGQILVRAEFNSTGQEIEPLWNNHIGKLASWIGARDVGSAPWRMGSSSGLEAEIVMPKKDDRRLWTGILIHKLTILQFIVIHLKEEYEIYQPQATAIITSLRFPAEVAGVLTSEDGLPMPPEYYPIPPQDIVDDILDPSRWRAFDGLLGIGALQAFYLREAVNYGWVITEFVSYPNPDGPGFARLILEKGSRKVNLGILPYESPDARISQPGRVVYKLD